MKQYWIVFLCLLGGLGAAIQAQAAPTLSLGSASVAPGGTTTIALHISGGSEPCAGVNARIQLPDGVSLTGVSNGALLSSNFTTAYHLNDVDDWGAVIAYSATETVSADGILLSLSVQVAANVAAGNYPLVVDTSGLSNADGSVSMSHATVSGMLTITGGAGNSYLLWTK